VKESGLTSPDYVVAQFHKYGINIRKVDSNTVSVSFDELSSLYHLDELIEIFINIKKRRVAEKNENAPFEMYEHRTYDAPIDSLKRTTPFLEQNVFKMKFSETNMMRYI
jgi:glycine dehydrogenase